MKSFLILLSVITSTYAGVGITTPEIEREALRLWQQYCDGQSEGGQAGSSFIYCKKARGAIKLSLKHEATIGSDGQPQDQVVFVQPPSYHYKHDVIVTGGGVAARKTVIYVKPAKNTHEVNIKDQTSPGGAAQKPTLFFLKGSHGGESVTDKSPQPVTKPPPTYLPPTQPSSGYNYEAPSALQF